MLLTAVSVVLLLGSICSASTLDNVVLEKLLNMESRLMAQQTRLVMQENRIAEQENQLTEQKRELIELKQTNDYQQGIIKQQQQRTHRLEMIINKQTGEIANLNKGLRAKDSNRCEKCNTDIVRNNKTSTTYRKRETSLGEWEAFGNTTTYYHTSTDTFSYCDAVSYCESMQTHLADIDTTDYNFISQLGNVLNIKVGDNFALWIKTPGMTCPVTQTNATVIHYVGALVHMSVKKPVVEKHFALCGSPWIPTTTPPTSTPSPTITTTTPTTFPSTTSATTTTQTTTREPTTKSFRQQPERVAFTAYLDHVTPHLGINHPIAYNRVLLNEGSAYHSTTGIFICPLDGLYAFYFSISTYGVQQDVAKLVVEGVNQVDAIADTFHVGHNAQGANFAMVSLTQGQQVWIASYHDADQTIDSGETIRFSTFSGFLLY